MAKITIIVPPLTGHVNPTLGFGEALLKRGHKVTWFSLDESLANLLPEGGELMPIPHEQVEMEKKKMNDVMNKADKDKDNSYGIDSLKFLYDEILLPYNRFVLKLLMQLLDEYPTDIIITDHQMIAGAVAAILKGIPYVTSVTAPAAAKAGDTLPQVYRWESEQVVKFQKENGIQGEERLDMSRLMTFVYTSHKLFGDTEMPDYFRFIGPVIGGRRHSVDFDWERLKKAGDTPKVLVSIGTTFNNELKRRFFEKVVQALADEDLLVIVVSAPDMFDETPSNFIVRERVPQLELLPHMQAVICHGGFNTVSESLSNGVPLVVLPIAYDQSYVAGRVTDVNAGLRLNFNRFKPAQLKDALLEILSDDKYRQNALAVRDSFIEAGGVEKGVEELENILKNSFKA